MPGDQNGADGRDDPPGQIGREIGDGDPPAIDEDEEGNGLPFNGNPLTFH
jgi:hypothetical protein